MNTVRVDREKQLRSQRNYNYKAMIFQLSGRLLVKAEKITRKYIEKMFKL